MVTIRVNISCREQGFFGQQKEQEAYNIINFWFLMENSILKKFGSVDVKITRHLFLIQLKSIEDVTKKKLQTNKRKNSCQIVLNFNFEVQGVPG